MPSFFRRSLTRRSRSRAAAPPPQPTEPLEPRVLLAVTGSSAFEGNDAQRNLLFDVTYRITAGEPVFVEYWTLPGGTATAGSDYVETSGTLVFQIPAGAPSGNVTQSFAVPLVGDTVIEADETVLVEVQREGRFEPERASGTIVNDDTVTVNLSDAPAAGEGSPMTFTVSLARPLAVIEPAVSVSYVTVNGTGTLDQDYTATSGTLTFRPGEPSSRQVTVAGLQDTQFEGDETVSLHLFGPSPGAIVGDDSGVAVIRDDDVGVSVGDAAAATEGSPAGQGGVLSFPVSLSRPLSATEGDFTVGYFTSNGTAHDGADFTGTAGVLVFRPGGPTTQPVTVTAQPDLLDEVNETVVLNLADATGPGSIGDGLGAGTIVDDDGPGMTPIPVQGGTVTEATGEARTITFLINADDVDPFLLEEDITYVTAPNTAGPGDYVHTTGTLRFEAMRPPPPAGETSPAPAPPLPEPIDVIYPLRAFVPVQVVGDVAGEPVESFFLVLRNIAGFELGRGEAFIVDDDYLLPEPFPTDPGARFDWSVPDRFGIDTNGNGVIDMPLSAEYAAADQFEVTLDGTYSRVTGSAMPDTYAWTVEGNTPGLPQALSGPRPTLSLPEGDYQVTLDVSGPDGVHYATVQTITVRDHLIVAIGDSYGSGEGNPERYRQYDERGNLLAEELWGDGLTPQATMAHRRHHRTSSAGAAQAALAMERADRRSSVTFLFLSQSGASVENGILRERVHPAGAEPGDNVFRGTNRPTWDGPQVALAEELAGTREVDFLTVSTGGNDIGFGGILSDLVLADLAAFTAVGAGAGAGLGAVGGIIGSVIGGAIGAVNGARSYFGFREQVMLGAEQRLAQLRQTHYVNLGNALVGGPERLNPRNVLITEYPDPTRDDSGNTAEQMLWEVVPGLEIDRGESDEARRRIIDQLNAAVMDAAAREAALGRPWRGVSGISAPYFRHGYAANNRFVRRFSDSMYIQGPGPLKDGSTTDHDPSTGTMHPNERGHQVYAERLLAEMRRRDPAPTPSVSVSDARVEEGTGGTRDLVFTVTLSNPIPHFVTLRYDTVAGSAAAGSDYLPGGGTLRFAPDTTSLTVRVPVVGDTADEPDETVTLSLSAPVNGTIADGVGTGTIVDDDVSSVPVAGVFVDGTGWGQAFYDELVEENLGSNAYGFRVQNGAAGEDELPWTNVNRVSLQFGGAGPINVDQADLLWASGGGVTYGVSGFVYNPVTRVATWTFDKPLGNYPTLRRTGDRIRFTLNGDPPDGVNLPGGDHLFTVNVVPGDANRNGNVSPTDYGSVRSGIGRNTVEEGTAPTNYTVFKDVNANGNVSPTDIGVVRGNTGANLQNVPTPEWPGRAASIAEELFGTNRIL